MSSKNSSKLNVPEAKAAMNKFKMEAASEVGVNLKQGYNGDISARPTLMYLHHIEEKREICNK